jgi:hypothetical protein
MQSKLAKSAERELIDANQRLIPTQRLNAMLTHSRLMARLERAAKCGIPRRFAPRK